MAPNFTTSATERLIRERAAAYAPRSYEDPEGAALVADALSEIRARWASRIDRRRLVAVAPAAPPAA
jgi:hypothetical protein